MKRITGEMIMKLGMKSLTALLVASCVALTACNSGSSGTAATSADDARRCTALIGAQLDSATIERAELVKRGTQLIGFWRRMMFRYFVGSSMPDLAASGDFCRVTAKLRPAPGSEITTEVWLPQQWNNKVLAIGGGGFNGGLSSASVLFLNPLKKGYVTIATNAGHDDTNSAQFTHDFPEQYTDYAYRANHVAAVFVKALAASYYGAPVQRAYFHGCSNGGRDALMEARRFPEDYDGIISGAPATAWAELMTSFAWNAQALRSAPKLTEKLKLVQAAVEAKCDALDGVQDKLLENPAACAFDPAQLQCTGGDRKDCLNAEEVTALRKIYEGPRLSDGTQVYAGMPPGGEGLENNWDTWITKEESMQANFALETFRWMVHRDPQWDLSRFDIDRDYPLAKERMAPMMNSDDPDLSAFVERGGRLLLYHGWNDAAIPAGATLDYYQSVRNALGAAADEHVRVFMVPGMMHCAGGVGPNDFDVIAEIDRWVESGVAPEQIIATEYDPPAVFIPARNAKAIRTRPLCAWPKVARYSGSGSTDDAANFRCE